MKFSLRSFYYPICGDCEPCKTLDKRLQFIVLMMIMMDED